MKIVTFRLRHGNSEPIKVKNIPDNIAEDMELDFFRGSVNRFRLSAEGTDRVQTVSMSDIVMLQIEDDPETEDWDH